jgi:hypothetical protein
MARVRHGRLGVASPSRSQVLAGTVSGAGHLAWIIPCISHEATDRLIYDQPMTAAIFGLIGVVVGGLLNGAVAAWQARRTDAHATRVGARLIDLELRYATLALKVLEDDGSKASGEETSRKFSTTAWDKYQEVLARTLSDKDWRIIAHAYEIVTGSPGRKLASALRPSPELVGNQPSRRTDAKVVLDATLAIRRVGEHPSFSKRIAGRFPHRPAR